MMPTMRSCRPWVRPSPTGIKPEIYLIPPAERQKKLAPPKWATRSPRLYEPPTLSQSDYGLYFRTAKRVVSIGLADCGNCRSGLLCGHGRRASRILAKTSGTRLVESGRQ